MKHKVVNQIYKQKSHGRFEKYMDIVINVSLILVAVVIFAFFVSYGSRNFLELFSGVDLLWTSFTIFSFIIGKQMVKNYNSYQRRGLIILLFCWIACFVVFGFYLMAKFMGIPPSDLTLFIGGLISYLIAVACNILAKVLNIID